MCNLRLPEFDKNRNVDQQKALVFQSETSKYDVILGADFLTKTGIDVKYSTGTMEWLIVNYNYAIHIFLKLRTFKQWLN